MKIILATLFTFCFAFADGQTPTVKVKRKGEKECDCHTVISKEFQNRVYEGKKKFPKGSSSVKGKVIDAVTKKPLANVAIEFLYGKSLVAAACTDSSGEFMLINMPLLKGWLTAKKCGFKTIEVLKIEPVKDKVTYQEVELIPIVEKKKK